MKINLMLLRLTFSSLKLANPLKMNKIVNFLLLFLLFCESYSQTTKPKFEGQTRISDKISAITQNVDTRNQAIIPQWRGQKSLGNITFDNDFDGARLSGITQNNDTLYTAIIVAENYPINPSPWYAFKITAKKPSTIWVHLTYLNAKHRYYPKISKDGKNWQSVDSTDCRLVKDPNAPNRTFQENALSESAFVRVQVDEKPTWIAAQELITTKNIDEWSSNLSKKPFVTSEIIGYSPQNRPLKCLRIGEDKTDA
jgi:hypothetical protein